MPVVAMHEGAFSVADDVSTTVPEFANGSKQKKTYSALCVSIVQPKETSLANVMTDTQRETAVKLVRVRRLFFSSKVRRCGEAVIP